ncbi:hypothetical protein ACA910_014507 [Epithemia clementina (nom. ined.)]
MENHIFSEPTPYPDGLIQPCWKVDVFRRGVDEPVATLEIHHDNLPPRRAQGKRKGDRKVLWKLPDSLDDLPRFGGLEKERLWELFKLEKKNRRKGKGNKNNGSNDNDSGGGGGDENNNSMDNDSSNHNQQASTNNNSSSSGIEDSTNNDDDSQRPAEQPPTQQPPKHAQPKDPPLPPPPPGFGGTAPATPKAVLEEGPKKGAYAAVAAKAAQKEISGNVDDMTPLQPGPTATTIPPPPGLTTNTTTPTPPSRDAAQSEQPPQQPQSSQPQSSQPKPPTTLPPLPAALVVPPPYFVFGSLQSKDIAKLSSDILSNIIGSHVAHILIQSLTTPGQLPVWLARYHAHAQKLLLFGTAQAMAHTAADRQRQWESLIYSPAVMKAAAAVTATTPEVAAAAAATIAPWDCQGWAVQTLLPSGSSRNPVLHKNGNENGRSNHNETGDNNNTDDDHTNVPLLVVLTGRTVQQQEILTYHLTLTLQPVVLSAGENAQSAANPTAAPTPPPGVGTAYQIGNEILSLARTTAAV